MGIKTGRILWWLGAIGWSSEIVIGLWADNLRFLGWQSDFWYLGTKAVQVPEVTVSGVDAIYEVSEGFKPDGYVVKPLGDKLLPGPGDLVWCKITDQANFLSEGKIQVFRLLEKFGENCKLPKRVKLLGLLVREKEGRKNFLVGRVVFCSEPLLCNDWLVCVGQ